jgi:hypothetical protein
MGNQQKFSRRTKSPPGFAMIDADVLKSAAWKHLNGSAAKLYVLLRSKTFGPLNNAIKNPLKISYEAMISGTGLTRQTIRYNLIALENLGFIDFKQHGGLKSGGLSSNEYVISQRFLKYDTPLFQKGAERKHPGYKDRGFSRFWQMKAQAASMKIIPTQSNFHTSNAKIN